MKEAAFQRALYKKLRPHCREIVKVRSASMIGVPDWFIASDVFSGWVELKVDDGKPTMQQSKLLRGLHGVIVRLKTSRPPRLYVEESPTLWVELDWRTMDPVTLLRALSDAQAFLRKNEPLQAP